MRASDATAIITRFPVEKPLAAAERDLRDYQEEFAQTAPMGARSDFDWTADALDRFADKIVKLVSEFHEDMSDGIEDRAVLSDGRMVSFIAECLSDALVPEAARVLLSAVKVRKLKGDM
jgi:hypothetical protein